MSLTDDNIVNGNRALFPFLVARGSHVLVQLECCKLIWDLRQTSKRKCLYCWQHPIKVIAMSILLVGFSHISHAQCTVALTQAKESMKKHCWKRLSNMLQEMELLNKKQISRVDNDNLFEFLRMHFNLQRLVYNLQSGPQWPFEPCFSISPVRLSCFFIYFLVTLSW